MTIEPISSGEMSEQRGGSLRTASRAQELETEIYHLIVDLEVMHDAIRFPERYKSGDRSEEMTRILNKYSK